MTVITKTNRAIRFAAKTTIRRVRNFVRRGKKHHLYGLHCDADTARLISIFAKGSMFRKLTL